MSLYSLCLTVGPEAQGQPSKPVSCWAAWLILKHGGLCFRYPPSIRPATCARQLAINLCGLLSPMLSHFLSARSKALCTCGRRPQLEALLQTCRSVVLWPGFLEGLPCPPPLPASQLDLELLLAWRLPGRAQAAITWERKHLTFEAATQYHLLCGGGRGRRLAINSLLRANSSSVLWNQTVLPPRGGAAPLGSFPSARLLGCSGADRNCLRVFMEDIQTRSSLASCLLPRLPLFSAIVYCASVSGASCCLLGLQL